MTEVMINASGVTRNFSISRGMFRGKQLLRAVNGVDLTVTRGEVLALVGESGCGKTTLAKILLGLLPQTTGSVSLCGTPIDTVPRLALARMIQPIFQDPYSSLNPRKSIGSIIGRAAQNTACVFDGAQSAGNIFDPLCELINKNIVLQDCMQQSAWQVLRFLWRLR